MPRLIDRPVAVPAVGSPPKVILEYVGRECTGDAAVSLARMESPSGWSEPGQRPDFDEITMVLRGTVRVEHEGGVMEVGAGQAVIAQAGEWVKYSTPGPEGAEYVSICRPAFTEKMAHRDRE